MPGKHTTRKGWLTKDFHYQQSPYTADVNAPIWTTQFGDQQSLRQIAKDVAWFFRKLIRQYSDPFSFRLLFAILDGRAPSMLELVDRPSAYEDVGRLCRWGMVIHELKNYEAEMRMLAPWSAWNRQSIDQFVVEREQAREKHQIEMANVSASEPRARTRAIRAKDPKSPPAALLDELRARCRSANISRPKAMLLAGAGPIARESSSPNVRRSTSTAAASRCSSQQQRGAPPQHGAPQRNATRPRSPTAASPDPPTSRCSSSSSPAAACGWAPTSTRRSG